MKRRVLIAALAGSMLASCVPKDDTPPQLGQAGSSGGHGNSPQPAPAVAQGGTLRLPLSIEPGDSALAELDLSDPRLFALARCIELPLLRALPSGELASGLASSHITTDGGKTWSFELRQLPGQDSEPGYLGQHLIKRYQELLRGNDCPLKAQLSDLVAGARDYAQGRGTAVSGLQLEAATLSIALTRKHQQFPAWASQPGLGVMLNRDIAQLPVGGFGPFGLSSIEGNTLVLRPNPDALDGQPALDELRFVCLSDPAKQVEFYRAGELDAANLPWEQIDELRAEPDLTAALVDHETAAMFLGVFDVHEFPWGDQQFQSKLGLRQALNYSLDVAMLAESQGGQFKPWRHFLPPLHKDYIGAAQTQRPVFANGLDTPAATAGLKAADHEQGNHLIPGMDLGYLRDGPVSVGFTKELLRYWRDVSVKLRPFPLSRDELRLRVERGTHEVLLIEHRPAYPDVDAAIYPLLHSSLSGTGGNLGWVKDKAIDLALVNSQSAEDDTARRKVLQGLSRSLEEQALAVFLGNASPSLLLRPSLAGLQLSPYDYDASLPAQDFSRLGFAESS